MILGTRYIGSWAIEIKQTGIDKINGNVRVVMPVVGDFFIIKANTPDDQLPALVEVFLTAKAAQDAADAQLNGYAVLN